MGKILSLGDVAWLLHHILPLPWMYRLARLHGRVVHLLNREKRAIVARNLGPFAKDSKDLRRMTRQFFELRQVRVLMVVLFLDMDPDKWEEHFAIDGVAHLDQALSHQKGVILLGSHLNSLGGFMALMILKRRGYDIAVALPSDAELYPQTVFGRRLRRRTDTESLKQRMGGFYVQFNVRPIIKKLAGNGVIGQTGDGWHSVSFARVPFLGRSLPFTTGMMSVAQSTGAMIVPLNVVGRPPYMRAEISPPFQVPKGENPEEDLTEAVAAYTRTLERALRENVVCWEHWLIADTLETMDAWTDRPLRDRYEL